ncbi:protein AF-10 isoform X2 [Episyrphus balteatus]|uniref:protein AF-10 isoform X2 n=1 Tax=Episyrphus balteatus TaxID=286459 RepID=UPI002485F41B|nr:protein AF-10 isoform X2 [Episyrphus balteatus]
MKEMVGGCCVCSDERGWPENPLVYCDGQNCTVAVHQACYGIVTVPTGPWYCRKCESQERPARVRCELCPSRDGALKRTDNQGWAHVVCALYIPEVRFGNVTTMEPIILQLIPSERYAKTCYICQEIGKPNRANVGACMQCNKFNCKQQFHVTCAQSLGLLCEEAGNYLDNVKYCGYCQHHYSKLKKGGNVKTIPPYKPITHDSSGSDSGSSPEKEIDSTVSATASSTSATSIKITNASGSSSASTSGTIGISSTKQRKSSIASKQSSLSSSSSAVTPSVTNNLSGTNAIVPGNSGMCTLGVPSSSNESTSISGGSNASMNLNTNVKPNNNFGSSKEKDKHSKNLNKISSSKDKDKEFSSSSSSSSREKGSKYKTKDFGEHGSGGTGVSVAAGGGSTGGQNLANVAGRSGMGMDITLSSTDNVFPTAEAVSNSTSSSVPMKNSGTSIAKKRKAESKAGIFGDANDINHSFRDIIKDVSVTLTPLPLDKTSDLGEVEKLSKKQRTELSPPTHQSTEPSIPNVSPKHLPSTKNHSHSSGSASQTQNVPPVESSISSSTNPSSSSSGSHKTAKERDERVRSSSPFTSTVSSVGGTTVTAGNTTAGAAPSLYVSVPLSTANVPGLNLPTTTTADHPTPSQSTRAATQQQQQSTVTERQSPRIHHQISASPVISEQGSFSSSLPSPVNAAVLQSGKSPSPSITGGNLTATTTETGNLKISFEKQNSRVAQLQEQESAPGRRSRSRSGEHINPIPTKPRFGKKRSAASTNAQMIKSSSSSSLTVSSTEATQQPQQQQRTTSSIPLISHTPDILSESSQKLQPKSPPLSALPLTTSSKMNDSDRIGNNSSINSNSSGNNNINKTNSNNNNDNNSNNSNNSAMNLSSSAPSTPTPTPPPIPSTPSSTVNPCSLPISSAPDLNFSSISSSTTQTTITSVKSNNSNENVNNTMATLIVNSCRNSCSPITPSPPAQSTPTPTVVAPPAGSNVPASKALNKKLLRAQQSHFLQQQQQQQQLAAVQQQQQTTIVAKTVEVTDTTNPLSSLPIDDSNSNTIPPPPTISRTPDSGIFSSSFNISGSSQNSLPGATSSANIGLKFSYEAQPGVATAAVPSNMDANPANNTAFKDSPPSSPGSEAGSARKRGRKSNEIKDVKVFQNGGCAVSTPVTTPTPASTSNGPIHATHMLGNQLNPTSSVAQKLTDQLHMEMQDHSVYTESQPPQFVGVPFPSKPVNNVRNPTSMPNSANSLASMFGGNGGGYAPQSLEQLLERQWEQGSQFLMEQAQHFDIASLLSCLHQLQTENVRLEEHVNSLIARRDHLLAVNARLAIPLNANVPQSQVNLNNIHINGPTQPDVAAAGSTMQPTASVPSTGSGNVTPTVATLTSNNRAPRSNAATSSQMPTMENGIDFRHSSIQQPTSIPAPTAAPAAPLPQSTSGVGLRHSSSVHPNYSTTNPSSSASHHSNHQHHQLQSHQHHNQQQQQPSLAQHNTMSSSASNTNSVMTSASVSRQTQQQAQPPPHHHPPQPQHPHQQTHHPQHHSHHAQQQHQQQQQQQQQSLHTHHQHTQHQPHPLVQHTHNHHHPSSTGPAAPHHIQQQPSQHHQMSIASSDSSMRNTGTGGNSGTGRAGNNSGGGGVGASQMLPGRPVHGDNSAYHPVYSHQPISRSLFSHN